MYQRPSLFYYLSLYKKLSIKMMESFSFGGVTQIRTGESGFCRPMPYHLAMTPYKDISKSISLKHPSFGADDEARTRYLHLGKVALYQMSYIRILGASGRNRTNDTRIFSPLLYRLSYRGICGDPERARTVDL